MPFTKASAFPPLGDGGRRPYFLFTLPGGMGRDGFPRPSAEKKTENVSNRTGGKDSLHVFGVHKQAVK